jgi:hypothetical protein
MQQSEVVRRSEKLDVISNLEAMTEDDPVD